MDVGRMSCASFVLPKCAEIGAVAPAAREEFIVEFMTELQSQYVIDGWVRKGLTAYYSNK
jgi:hypothetical protein